MATYEASGRRIIRGPGAELYANLRASTPLEGPQILLEWDALAFACDAFRVLRKLRQPPEHEADGDVVFSRTNLPEVQWHADLTVMPLRFYHYAAFARMAGQWIQVGTDWAYSGEPPYLEESGVETTIATGSGVGPCATTATLTSASGWAVGDWALIGKARRLIARVLEVDGATIRFERIGALGDPTVRTLRGVRVSFVTGTGIVRRTAGSWKDDGFKALSRWRVRGAATATGANGAWGVTAVADHELRLDTTFTANETTWVANFAEEPGIVSGEPVLRMVQRATRMQRKLYDCFPPHWRNRDKEAGQGLVLNPAQLADGSYANLGEPGEQYALQRVLRPLGALIGRAAAAAEAYGTLIDLTESPAAFLRGYTSMHGYVPPADAPDYRVRSLVAMQPHVVRKKGVGERLGKIVRAVTAQEVDVVLGADRVLRFNELNNGLCSFWTGLPTALAAQLLTDAFAKFPVNGLVGWKVKIASSLFTILSNTATTITTDPVDGSMTGAGAVATGTSDATEMYAAVSGANLVFAAADQSIVRGDAVNWSTKGYVVNTWINISGATNASNNGWFEVVSITTTKIVLGTAGIVNETSTIAVVQGGVLQQNATDADQSFSAGMVGSYIAPNTADTAGPNGSPRSFLIATFTDVTRIATSGANMLGVASPGNTFRIAPKYTIQPPRGGRLDPRPSIYTPKATSCFNDRGVMLFVDNDISDALALELDARATEQVPATTTLRVMADGGGDGSVDAELLAVG